MPDVPSPSPTGEPAPEYEPPRAEELPGDETIDTAPVIYPGLG
jgi:hypothetical protein